MPTSCVQAQAVLQHIDYILGQALPHVNQPHYNCTSKPHMRERGPSSDPSARERFETYQATYTLAGPPELRWGDLKGSCRREETHAHGLHSMQHVHTKRSSVCDTTYPGVIQTRTPRNREDTHACDVAT